jgi:adenylate cyclase
VTAIPPDGPAGDAVPARDAPPGGEEVDWWRVADSADTEAEVVSALEGYLPSEPAELSIRAVSESSGIDLERLTVFWRALGFPQAPDDAETLTASDAELLSTFVSYFLERGNDRGIGLQLARVIGTSLDRVASAQIDALVAGVLMRPSQRDHVNARTREFSGMMPRLMELVWRRHLANAARRRLLRPTVGDAATLCVGFADMVGFTAQSQQLDQIALARVIGRFEALAYEVVTRYGGRVVKTIGDEVMFLTEDARSGAKVAIGLASSFREAPDLPNVRVGLAAGPVLQRRGDVYGPTVNLASRIVGVAFPGTVLVSESVHEALVDDDEIEFASTETYYLKDIGETPVWRLGGGADMRGAAARALLAANESWRRRLVDRWRERDERTSAAVRRELDAANERGELPERVARVLDGNLPPEVVDQFAMGLAPEEIETLARAILATDLEPELQLDLLADLGATPALRELGREADRRVAEADEEANRRLRAIEDETARRVSAAEREAREKVSAALAYAATESRKVVDDVNERFDSVMDDARRKEEQARRDARARAARQAQRARTRNRDARR